MRAGENDDPDFTYRIRLATGHLVEALDALNAYSRHKKVKSLMARVSNEARQRLKVARGAPQKAGRGALKAMRNNTFHYPSPESPTSPTSDKELKRVLKGMADRPAELHVKYEEAEVTHSFGDDAALALAMGKRAPSEEQVLKQSVAARDGAIAFIKWADALVIAYLDATGTYLGTPQPK